MSGVKVIRIQCFLFYYMFVEGNTSVEIGLKLLPKQMITDNMTMSVEGGQDA